jgi:hypothetical protein
MRTQSSPCRCGPRCDGAGTQHRTRCATARAARATSAPSPLCACVRQAHAHTNIHTATHDVRFQQWAFEVHAKVRLVDALVEELANDAAAQRFVLRHTTRSLYDFNTKHNNTAAHQVQLRPLRRDGVAHGALVRDVAHGLVLDRLQAHNIRSRSGTHGAHAKRTPMPHVVVLTISWPKCSARMAPDACSVKKTLRASARSGALQHTHTPMQH